jgi:hypothetical protein
MSERKHKRGSEEIVGLETDEASFALEPAEVEVGSGYALVVRYDENENQVVDIKTYGEINITHVRREIAQLFPNARIRQLNQTGSVIASKKSKGKNKTRKK